jgi:hypothetical protein
MNHSKMKRLWRKIDFNGKTFLLCVSFYTLAIAKSEFVKNISLLTSERYSILPDIRTTIGHGRLVGKIIVVALSDCYPQENFS